MTKTRNRSAVWLLLLGALVYLPVAWHSALPIAPHSDVVFATQSARGFSEGLAEGRAYPRWIADANRGHGAPTFLYYSPGAYYAAAAARLVTSDTLQALRLTSIALALLSGLTFFLAMRRWSSDDTANAIAAALYVAMPYHVLDLVERFALAEFAAFVLYPVVFATADRLIEGPSRRAWAGLALSYGALVFTHLVSAFMLAFVLSPYLAIRAGLAGRPARLLPAVGAVATGLACSAAFLVPILFERGAIHIEYVDQMRRFDWRRGVLFVDEVAAGYPRASVKPMVEWSATSQAFFSLGVLGAIGLRRRRTGNAPLLPAAKGAVMAWGVLAVWTFVLQTSPSAPVWALTPGLATVQFPWRFAGFQALAACVLTAVALGASLRLPRKGEAWGCVAAALPALAVATFIATGARFEFDREMAESPNVRGRPAYAYMPRDVTQHQAIRDVPARLTPQARLASGEPVEILSWTPHERRLRYRAESATTLQVRTFDFPGWTATLDGQAARITPSGRWRSLTLAAPAGTHEVVFRFGGTPLRTAASALTLATVAALALMALPRRNAAARSVALLAVLLAGGGCGAPSQPTPQNLVVLTLDTVRPDHLSAYGYAKPTTPELRAFAEESVVFSNAFAQETNTTPSHASMFTGQYPHVHGSRVNGDVLASDVPTLAAILRDAGFATAGFVSASVLSAEGSGLDRGFDRYGDELGRARRTGVQTVRQARQWLATREPGERFFLFVHLYDAHGPYRPPAKHRDAFRSRQPSGKLPLVPHHMKSVDESGRLFRYLSQFVDQYDGTLRHSDDLFRLLREGIDLDDTAVVVLADHGETLGERYHGLDHGGQVFDEQIRIPLLLHAPALRPRRVDALVETVDLLPTALQLLRVPAPPDLALPGRSLLPLAIGTTGEGASEDEERFVFSSARAVSHRHGDRGYTLDLERRIQSIRSRRWKLIRYPREPATEGDYYELYDLASDPGELRDVAEQHPEIVETYRARLEAWDPDLGARRSPATPPDARLQRQLRELGYVD